MPQKKLILVAATTGYQTRSFAEAARRVGLEVVLATDRCHVLEDPWADHAVPVQFDKPEESASAVAKVAAGARGVVAVGDRPTLIAALAAERLQLPFHPPSAVRIARNKHLSRDAFGFGGLPVPRHVAIPLGTDPAQMLDGVGYPCVLKPVGLSASRGVIRADNRGQALVAWKRIAHLLREPDLQRQEDLSQVIQIESYVPGREFALEGLLTHGDLEVLAIFDKPDPLEGPYFEETIYVTPSRESPSVQAQITAAAKRAISSIGLTDGPIHAEMRVNEQGVYVLEVAARPIGGLCARTLRFEGDMTLEEVIVLHAVRRRPERLVPWSPASGVMMIPVPGEGILDRVCGVQEALAIPGIRDVIITAKLGQKLVPLPEGASYPGFVFAEGSDPAAVEHALRRAHQQLQFELLPVLRVMPNSSPSST